MGGLVGLYQNYHGLVTVLGLSHFQLGDLQQARFVLGRIYSIRSWECDLTGVDSRKPGG